MMSKIGEARREIDRAAPGLFAGTTREGAR